jgi:FkbM family methyltransferase
VRRIDGTQDPNHLWFPSLRPGKTRIVISFAQNFEDVILNRIFQGRSDGFYIDVGAHDPEELSVTRYFYELGWSGINIEPVPGSFEKFVRQRPRDVNLNIGLGARHQIVSLYEVELRPELTSLSQSIALSASRLANSRVVERPAEIRTLREVCNTYCRDRPIDFLKIDVEGFEREVILGGDWSTYRPTALLIESTEPCSYIDDWEDPDKHGTWKVWEPLLLDADYLFAYYDGLNRLYIRKEDAHFTRRFRIPISVLQDGFSLYRDLTKGAAEVREELARADLSASELRSALDRERAAAALVPGLQECVAESERRMVLLDKQVKESIAWAEDLEGRVAALLQGASRAAEERGWILRELEWTKSRADESERVSIALVRQLEDADVVASETRERTRLMEQALRVQGRANAALRSVLGETLHGDGRLTKLFRGIRASSACDAAHPASRPVAVAATPEPAVVSVDSGVGDTPRPLLGLRYPLEDTTYAAEIRASLVEQIREHARQHDLLFVEEVSAIPPTRIAELSTPWLGLCAAPNRLPPWAGRTLAYRDVIYSSDLAHLRQTAKTACRGLVLFSEDHAAFLAASDLPLITVKCLLPRVSRHWNQRDFDANRVKSIVQHGWWLMRVHGLALFPSGLYRKLWIRTPSRELAEVHRAERQALQHRFGPLDALLTPLDELAEPARPDLEQILCTNIAFAHFRDASAPTFLMTCIAHHTPILVNPLPAIREYLGDDYPLYYYFYEDALDKASDPERLRAAHEHLRRVALGLCSARRELGIEVARHLETDE